MSESHRTASLVGNALLYSGLQFALGSVEMSSKYSVENFSKDQATLQAAADALCTYFIIAIVWTIASCLVLYGSFGMKGIFWGIITNVIFVGWIVISYWTTFKKVAKNNNLKMPHFFGLGYNPSPVQRQIILE